MPQKSTFYLPTQKQTPCILIASGAGIAPFMSFLEDKAHELNKNGVSNFGEMNLFFGFRHPDQDYLYKEQLASYKSQGMLDRNFEAVSRGAGKKTYVQDALRSQKDMVKYYLETEGRFYVCGGKDMADGVTKVIEDCISELNGGGIEKDSVILDKLKKDERLNIEAWG
jgi:sulfite reductase alpha subunit-like flavoprotein